MIAVLAKEFRALDMDVADTIHIAAHNVLAGVPSDEGEDDDWPAVRKQVPTGDIPILGTPIWMGHAGSVAKRPPFKEVCETFHENYQNSMPKYPFRLRPALEAL